VLDDVDRRRLFVEPARENPLELPLRVSDVELDKGAGELLYLPGGARLAGAEPDDDVPRPQHLAGLHRKVARDAVALVEKADDGDALRHRRGARRHSGDRLRNVHRLGFLLGLRLLLGLWLRNVAVAGAQR
jgi:hypothetical protein